MLQSEWKCELCEVRPWGWGSGCKDKESLEWECLGLGLIFFFVFIVPLKPNWFGSVGVLPVSGFGNRNRTEPKIFTKKIIGLIGFFFGSVFSVIFFSVYSVSRFFCSPLTIMQHAPLLSGGGAETLWSSWKLGFGHRTIHIF